MILIVLSLDVLASLNGGNVALVLLFATLAAAKLMWDRHAPFAAPLIALVVLIRPFYALFFIVFGLLQLLSYSADVRSRLRPLVLMAAITVGLIGVEVYCWGAELRAETLRYVLQAGITSGSCYR